MFTLSLVGIDNRIYLKVWVDMFRSHNLQLIAFNTKRVKSSHEFNRQILIYWPQLLYLGGKWSIRAT